MIAIHEDIQEKLRYFYTSRKIPNILFNGPSGSGKSTMVNNFVSMIYGGNKEKIKNLVMFVNCAHGKGIKFIREELKFFAKTNIHSNGGEVFKSIVLFNGDKLTMDAQSALRRCIELFSHNTRFFVLVEDKYKLLRPILSRFCEIYLPEPGVNLYRYNLEQTFPLAKVKNQRQEWLLQELSAASENASNLPSLAAKLYEKAYSAIDIIRLLEKKECFGHLEDTKRYELLIAFSKAVKEFRNEKLLMLFVLQFLLVDTQTSLENMSFL